MILELTPDELLSTTRAVRKRLDLTRPVEPEVLEECLRLAQQAPTASYSQNWHFVVVTDPEKRAALADLWRSVAGPYLERRPAENNQFVRIGEAVRHLAEHLHEVPVHVIPCVHGRTEDKPVAWQASIFGSIVPATWSFMLAARSRGLGSVWTTFHLMHERAAAEILEIPYEQVMQVALIPVAYTIGTEFKPGRRKPLETMVHWDRWTSRAASAARSLHGGNQFPPWASLLGPCVVFSGARACRSRRRRAAGLRGLARPARYSFGDSSARTTRGSPRSAGRGGQASRSGRARGPRPGSGASRPPCPPGAGA